MVEKIIAGLAVAVIMAVSTWAWRKFLRPEIRIMTATEQGPTSRELGFTETAVKITIWNQSGKDIQIKDIRLMFCGNFGAPVAQEAPPGRSHRELPVSLTSGADENWFIPAQRLSELLRSLYHPQQMVDPAMKNVKLHARCMTGTGKVYKSPSFMFSTDPNSHWP